MKLFLLAGFACAAAALLFMWFAKWRVDHAAKERIHRSAETVPERRVGLVLGCVRYLDNGRENLYFRYRIDAAADLYRAGKVRYLLVSGDNSRKGYNESEDMKQALVEKGVPADRVVCDYAGFSTLDSVVRAREVFGETELTVVSQEFHARRAIYIGKAKGVDLVGLASRDVSRAYGAWTRLREALARCKTLLDVSLLNRQPRFLGERELIGNGKE